MPARAVGRWFWVPRPSPAPRVRLVCLPHAGGDATGFAALARCLPTEIELWAVRLPGRGARIAEPPATSLDALVAALTEALVEHVPGSYVLAGQSAGGAVAFRLCRALSGVRPARGLVVAAVAAPALWSRPGPALGPGELVGFLHRIDSGAAALLEQPRLRELALAALSADLDLVRGASPDGGSVDVPVHALVGTADPLVSPADMAGWRDSTTRSFRLSTVAAGHFPLQTQAAEVASLLGADPGCRPDARS